MTSDHTLSSAGLTQSRRRECLRLCFKHFSCGFILRGTKSQSLTVWFALEPPTPFKLVIIRVDIDYKRCGVLCLKLSYRCSVLCYHFWISCQFRDWAMQGLCQDCSKSTIRAHESYQDRIMQ